MKTKKNTNAKFSLEKFEIAKLKNLQSVKGGAGEIPGNDPIETTATSKNCNNKTVDTANF